MSPLVALLIALGLIALSAFFVAAEFALVAARDYRLRDAAATNLAARAALRASRELSVVLAGSQLGITLCTLGLGAVAKPAVHDLLLPVLRVTGLPETIADITAFLLALAVVTLAHLVIGEMAPKSWAITHPERSAILLALPMRAFITLTRPLLAWLNGLANWCLRRVRVAPVDEVAIGHSPASLRELVDHSAQAGTLDPGRHDRLIAALQLHTTTLRGLARPLPTVRGVHAADTAERVREVARDSGHLRLVVWPATDAAGTPIGMVHVRDTLTADPTTIVSELTRPALTLAADTPVYPALSAMRAQASQFALVTDGTEFLGLVTMHDLLDRLLPPSDTR